MGVQKMTKEHIGVAIALNIPLFGVITKVDMAPEKILKKSLKDLYKILKHPQCGKMPVLIKKESDIEMCFEEKLGTMQPRICPVFLVSSVKGINIDVLRAFLSRLQAPRPALMGEDLKDEKECPPAVLQIDETFSVTGVGVVVSGVVQRGVVKLNEQMLLGPFSNGEFKQVTVRGIHVKRTAVDQVVTGVGCAIAIRGKALRREQIRRGMVLVDDRLNPQPIYGFQAEVLVLHHPTTIKNNYQCVVHCGCTRQAASMALSEELALRTGDRALVDFHFLYYPEWVSIGDTIVFREGSTKGVGKVVKILYEPGEQFEAWQKRRQ